MDLEGQPTRVSPAGIAGRVARLARERDGEALADFAVSYLRRPVALHGEPEEDAEGLLAEIRGAFALADGRDGAAVAVRAFTPRGDEHGYDASGSVLETNTEDLPFLVDSINAELHARGMTVRHITHPIVGVRRALDGHIAAIAHPRDAPRESVMHFELEQTLTPEELAGLEDGARHVLLTVRAVVGDFPALTRSVDRLEELLREGAGRLGGKAEAEEARAFLEWLADDHFVFLGYREDERVGDAMRPLADSGLGLLRARAHGALHVPAHDPPTALQTRSEDVFAITRTQTLSPVHRRVPMSAILVRRFDADGVLTGEARLLGLFTSHAYAEPASSTPVLRRRLRQVIEGEDLVEGSHDAKVATAIFDTYPKAELFAASVSDLRGELSALLALDPDDVALLGRRSADGCSATLIGVIPRDRHSAALRDLLRDLVAQAYGTDRVDVQEVLGDAEQVHVHLSVRSQAGVPDVDLGALERRLIVAARSWADRVGDELVRLYGAERGRVLAARWLKRLPEAYRAAVPPAIAAIDVANFEALENGTSDLRVGLQDDHVAGAGAGAGAGAVPGAEAATGRTRVAIYKQGPKVELSQATPMLEHHGLRVIEEVPARLLGEEELWLQAFGVLARPVDGDVALDLEAVGDRLAESLEAVWRGATESDSLNRLVVTAGVGWQQVHILRAYRRYRQRLGSRYAESFQNDVIAAHPAITAKLIRLFTLRFATDERGGDEAAQDALRQEIVEDLDGVALLDHDRILRNQLGAIEATVRTNVFSLGHDAMAFKLRSADVPAIPQPPPLFEIYVYTADMEGIHLRGGRIARGGIRWSDRMDYRTEVFGLMRAQMTKNAIIVPDGAKGGFLLKNAAGGAAVAPDEQEVRRQYVRYIEALLDVTDDLGDDGTVVAPAGVRVHDEQDSYLVVAADKGTARFSDTANAVAVRRGFWLGDAFASGGSTGYDHKGLGITAKGAWESVKRHFSALGVDPEVDVVRTVGIGDMSGDVFGNGMLLSRSLALVAAYDHRHVFIDPDPDPQRSFAERRRLFELPASSWDDYDRALISEGGGVWSRDAKQIRLSRQVRAALGIEDELLAPTDVIRAILRAPVDLLWNGGIGTVVKARSESDADARDRSSDTIRVDAAELRCRVVAEGGNLGVTQRGRIEYARAGGLINADFIDNSAGVDCSDHEVNLKILLDLAVRRGELDPAGRNSLLAEVTDDVVAHVLYDSFLQAQILAQEVRTSAARLFAYEDLMEALEAASILARDAEALPSSEEMAERRHAGQGLERPELAVLVAYAKRLLTAALLASDLPEDAALRRDLLSYFPPAIAQRFGDLIFEHPLRRELIATLAANDVVDALGPTFVIGLARELGADAAEVVRSFRMAREVTGATQRWLEIEGHAATLDHEVAWRLLDGVDDLVAGVTRWYVLRGAGPEPADGAGPEPADGLEAHVASAHEAFVDLAQIMPALRSQEWREQHEAVADELRALGVPDALARAHAYQPALLHAPDIIAVAHATGRDTSTVARTFFALGERLRLEWLEQEVLELPGSTRLQRWAQQALLDELLAARRMLAQRALEESPAATPEDAIEAFLARREALARRLANVSRTLTIEADGGLAGLTLAARQLRALAG